MNEHERGELIMTLKNAGSVALTYLLNISGAFLIRSFCTRIGRCRTHA